MKTRAPCFASIEVSIKNTKAGGGHTDEVHKFKLWDKIRALEALAKHFGLLTEASRSERLGQARMLLALSSPMPAVRTTAMPFWSILRHSHLVKNCMRNNFVSYSKPLGAHVMSWVGNSKAACEELEAREPERGGK
jgi:hypothetical protein